MNVIDLNANPAPCLNGVPMARETKKELLEIAHKKGSSYKHVTEKYNLKYNTLRGYYKRFKHDRSFQMNRGRPCKLDDESCSKILNWMSDNPDWERSDIRLKIKEEVVSTDVRRFPDGFQVGYFTKVCRNTVGVYATMLEAKFRER